jgi:hypothetical protein
VGLSANTASTGSGAQNTAGKLFEHVLHVTKLMINLYVVDRWLVINKFHYVKNNYRFRKKI